jgi:hypothetical protein
MLTPGPLYDIQTAGDPLSIAQTNFELLTEHLYKFTATRQNGASTTLIGPPTTGDRLADELWRDAWMATWRCTVAGTPGTWRQETPAVRAGEPGSGTIPTGYVILDSSDNYRRKVHEGGYVWRDVDGIKELVVNARDWLAGDGATDDSAAFALMVAAIPAGATIFFPGSKSGTRTYLANSLVISKDLSIRIAQNAVIKHKADATDHLLKYTAACTGFLEGGTIDGNKSNQTKASAFAAHLSCVFGYSDGMTIRGVTIQNFVKTAIRDYQGSTEITILGCKFLEGYRLTAATDELAAGCITIDPAVTDARVTLTVEHCRFANTAPSGSERQPGGIFVAGSGAANCYISVTIRNNRFKYVGGDTVIGSNHYGIAPVDLYEEVLDAVVEGNKIYNCAYICLKLQNSENLTCTSNTCSTTYTSAIDYTPGERLQSSEYTNATIAFNTVLTTALVGIYVRAGDAGGWRETSVLYNKVSCPTPLRVSGLTGAATTEGYGPLFVIGNKFTSTSGNCAEFSYIAGHVEFSGNHLNATTGNGLAATTAGNSAATFVVIGNRVICNTTGYRCLRVFGVKALVAKDNILTAATSGDVALEVDQDGSANPVEYLAESGNIIITGTKSINYSAVRRVEAQHRVVASDHTVGANSGSSETDLFSATIPAYTLNANGQSLEFVGAGIVVNSANNKRIRVYLGSTTLYDSGNFGAAAGANIDFRISGVITRVTATAQNSFVEFRSSSTTIGPAATVDYVTGSETLTNDLTLRVTGLGGASSEVFLGFLKVKFEGTPST